jgi:hypothetical protein
MKIVQALREKFNDVMVMGYGLWVYDYVCDCWGCGSDNN